MATGRSRVGMIAAALDRDSGSDRLAGFARGARRSLRRATGRVDPALRLFRRAGMR